MAKAKMKHCTYRGTSLNDLDCSHVADTYVIMYYGNDAESGAKQEHTRRHLCKFHAHYYVKDLLDYHPNNAIVYSPSGPTR